MTLEILGQQGEVINGMVEPIPLVGPTENTLVDRSMGRSITPAVVAPRGVDTVDEDVVRGRAVMVSTLDLVTALGAKVRQELHIARKPRDWINKLTYHRRL
jgi:hypothetical protein